MFIFWVVFFIGLILGAAAGFWIGLRRQPNPFLRFLYFMYLAFLGAEAVCLFAGEVSITGFLSLQIREIKQVFTEEDEVPQSQPEVRAEAEEMEAHADQPGVGLTLRGSIQDAGREVAVVTILFLVIGLIGWRWSRDAADAARCVVSNEITAKALDGAIIRETTTPMFSTRLVLRGMRNPVGESDFATSRASWRGTLATLFTSDEQIRAGWDEFRASYGKKTFRVARSLRRLAEEVEQEFKESLVAANLEEML